MVEKEWKSYKIQGWSGFIIKEKLKRLRHKIRGWHLQYFGNINNRIQEKSDLVDSLDKKSEQVLLLEEEILERNS